MSRKIVVGEGAAGKRLDVYLAGELGISRSQAQKVLARDDIRVNNAAERPSYQLAAGDKVVIDQQEAKTPSHPAPKLAIIYEDDDMVVVDKPAGLVVHAGNGRTDEPTVVDFARTVSTDDDPDRPGIVHRLDRDTSGLLVIAKTAAAKEALQQQWRDRKVSKTYRLLVVGRVDPAEAVIRLPLDRDPMHPTQRRVSPSGRPAVTRYRTLADLPGYTYLEAYPETGRTHQLRVHFAALGHPVAGDTVYGSPKRIPGLSRHFLHAYGLELTAPSGQRLSLTSPLPPELETTLSNLMKQV